MRIIRGTWEETFIKWKKEIQSLQKRLALQIATDDYKDDLIATLKSLLAYKEEAIDHLKGQLEELKR